MKYIFLIIFLSVLADTVYSWSFHFLATSSSDNVLIDICNYSDYTLACNSPYNNSYGIIYWNYGCSYYNFQDFIISQAFGNITSDGYGIYLPRVVFNAGTNTVAAIGSTNMVVEFDACSTLSNENLLAIGVTCPGNGGFGFVDYFSGNGYYGKIVELSDNSYIINSYGVHAYQLTPGFRHFRFAITTYDLSGGNFLTLANFSQTQAIVISNLAIYQIYRQ